MLFLVMATSAYAQKYSTVADTLKLNKEYRNLSSEIAELTAEITTARGNLSAYTTEANRAEDKARTSAEDSSDKASKATSGDLHDAKRAKAEANTAYKRAKDSKSADKHVKKQKDLIEKLTKKLTAKLQRYHELETMRNEILQQDPAQSTDKVPLKE
jgi:prefoldin subunit 5